MDDVTLYNISATTADTPPIVSYWLYGLAGVMCLISILIGCGFACTQFCKACLFSYPACQRGARSLKTNPVMRWLRRTRECLLGGRCNMEEDLDDINSVHPEVVVDTDTTSRTEVERSIELFSPPPPYMEALNMPRPLNPLPSANPNYVISSLSDVNVNNDHTSNVASENGHIEMIESGNPNNDRSTVANENNDIEMREMSGNPRNVANENDDIEMSSMSENPNQHTRNVADENEDIEMREMSGNPNQHETSNESISNQEIAEVEANVNTTTDVISTNSTLSHYETNPASSVVGYIREINSQSGITSNHGVISVATSTTNPHHEISSVAHSGVSSSREVSSIGLLSTNSNYEMNSSVHDQNLNSDRSTLTNVS